MKIPGEALRDVQVRVTLGWNDILPIRILKFLVLSLSSLEGVRQKNFQVS